MHVISNFFSEFRLLSLVMQEGEILTREQIEDEIKKIKEAHAEDEGIFLLSILRNSILWGIIHTAAN